MAGPNGAFYPKSSDYADLPRIGRYVLVREIARSNDIVWEATDPQMNRRVAVKELALPPTLTGQARRERIERFYREARAAGAMNHPNIVTIYEVGEDDGRYFIAMEYLEGQTLRERIAAGGPLPVSEAVRITGALCDALSYAHARGVIHRDIKPDNVHLLPDGNVKLTDFGIARITHEESLTLDGQVFGTPSYMSPEQVMGKNIDSRSDIFSLGILLYEMLSGRKPFTGDSVVTITYRILHDALPPLTGVPPLVDAVVRRAAAKEPDARFASAADLKMALASAAATGTGMTTVGSGAGYAPLPARSSSIPPQPTVVAATAARTQRGAAPAVPALYPSPPLPPPVPETARGAYDEYLVDRASYASPNRVLMNLLVGLLVLGLLLVGGWAMSRAYTNSVRQARSSKEYDRLNAAMILFQRGEFQQAALAFRALNNSPNAEVRAKAPLYESYCYRSLANQVIGSDLAEAERLLRIALGNASEAVRRARTDENAQREYEVARRQLDEVLEARGRTSSSRTGISSGGAPGATAAPEPTLDGMTPRPGTSGGANAPNTAALQNATNAAWAEAARHLETGDTAWKRGDENQALRSWNLAEQTGPGSPAAITARDRLNRYNANTPPLLAP